MVISLSWRKALWIKSPRAQLCCMPGTQLQATGLDVLRLNQSRFSISCHSRPQVRRSPELWPSAATTGRPLFRSPCLRTKPSNATFSFRLKPARARPSPTGWRLQRNLLGGAERFERAAAPLALIVAPTRELAFAGPSRTRMALSICGWARRPPASAAWIRAASSASCRGRSHRGRDARPIVRSPAARPSGHLGIEGCRPRRGR